MNSPRSQQLSAASAQPNIYQFVPFFTQKAGVPMVDDTRDNENVTPSAIPVYSPKDYKQDILEFMFRKLLPQK